MDVLPNHRDKGQTTRSTAPAEATAQPVSRRRRQRRLVSRIFVAVIVVALLVAGWLFYNKMQSNGSAAIQKNEYQAVFLTNGQVYFGKLQNANGDYLQLTNIYYLQVQQAVQPADTKTADASQNQTQLVKLGNELHGPQDSMQISSKQVLFWENLKSDGKVSQAISQYKP